jgi:hypothetical protein
MIIPAMVVGFFGLVFGWANTHWTGTDCPRMRVRIMCWLKNPMKREFHRVRPFLGTGCRTEDPEVYIV